MLSDRGFTHFKLALGIFFGSTVCVHGGTSYKTDVALYSSQGKLLWESSAYDSWGTNADQFNWIGKDYSLCPWSPGNCDGIKSYIGGSRNWNAAGGNNLFNYLETQQYVIPSSFAGQVGRVKFTVKTPGSPSYRVFYKDQWINDNGKDWTSQVWGGSKPSPELTYPANGGSAGDPMYFSLLDVESDGLVQGNRVLGIWLSFRSSAPCTGSSDAHCCHLTNRSDNLWHNGFSDKDNNCVIKKPDYQCFESNGSPWSSGKQVTYINFLGSLSQMIDGKPINIFFDDGVESAIPLTNSYARTEVYSSTACSTICSLLYGDQPWSDKTWETSISKCQLKQTQKVAQEGLGSLTISGFGQLSGYTLMNSGSDYFGQQVWHDFDGTNAGSSFSGGVFGDHYKTMEWAVMSGLAELTTSNSDAAFPIDISNIAVAWAPKRGDAAILLNAPYVTLDKGGSSNHPARLVDVKTPGAWIDAADGPNLLSDNSVMEHVYLHHADDMIKISASGIKYREITAIQGNVGSLIELGNYGDGLRTGKVSNSAVSGVYVHRIVHANGGYDGNGGIFGTRTCPTGASFSKISVNNLSIPALDGANTVGQLFAIGSLSGQSSFCSNTKSNTVFEDLTFLNWRVYVNPSMDSKMFGNGVTTTTIRDIYFYDTNQKSAAGILDSGVQIYDSTQHFYCVCAVLTGANKCWDMNGVNPKGSPNVVFKDVSATALHFPYGPAPAPEKVKLI